MLYQILFADIQAKYADMDFNDILPNREDFMEIRIIFFSQHKKRKKEEIYEDLIES